MIDKPSCFFAIMAAKTLQHFRALILKVLPYILCYLCTCICTKTKAGLIDECSLRWSMGSQKWPSSMGKNGVTNEQDS